MHTLDNTNARYLIDLAHHYLLDITDPSMKIRTQAASKALAYFELAYKTSKDVHEKEAMRQSLAEAAYAALQFDKAKKYAKDMLAENPAGWNHGNNIHHGNNILGKLALKNNDVARAKKYLIEAGKTPGSPQLDSFGPEFSLAASLLQRGEKEVVLQYLDLCSKFWDDDRQQIAQWKKGIEASRVPNF